MTRASASEVDAAQDAPEEEDVDDMDPCSD